MHLKIFLIGVAALLGLSVAAAQEPVLTLEAALAEAAQHNAALGARQAQADVAAERPRQEGALPDPELEFSLANVPIANLSLREEPMTQIEFGVMQPMPYPGKLRQAQRAAQREADAAQANVQEAHRSLAGEVRRSWWRLFSLDRALEIVGRNRDLLEQLVVIAQAKYRVGEGRQQDVLLAQLERSNLLDRELELNGQRAQAEAELNALLNRPAGQALRLPAQAGKALPRVRAEEWLQARALEVRAELAARRAMVEAARARTEVSRLDYYPDFRLGAAYGARPGFDDMVTLRFGMTFPVRAAQRQDRARAQRLREEEQQQLELRARQNEVAAEVRRALVEYRQIEEQLSLLETGILPQASQTVDSMRAGYQVNKVDFLALVRTQIDLRNLEIRYWQLFGAARQTLAMLQTAVGEENIYE